MCPVPTDLKSSKPSPAGFDGVDLGGRRIIKKKMKKKLIDFYHNNKYVTACSYCKGRGYGEGKVGAAIQTKKALPVFAQS
jgi:hypothetical protein